MAPYTEWDWAPAPEPGRWSACGNSAGARRAVAGLADSLLVAVPQDWLPYRDTRYVELFVVVDKTEVPWGGAGRGGVGQGRLPDAAA